MGTNDKSSDIAPAPVTKKKPYVKPSFRCEKIVETNVPSRKETPNSSFQRHSSPKPS
jgi:hypothetical protein